MKIVVLVKQTEGEIGPFDAAALEYALQIQGSEVTVISMGRPDVEKMLLGLTRLGLHRAILLTDKAFAGADTLATSYTLSLMVKKIAPDLVFCGRQSIDGDTAQVGPCLSVMLGYSLVTNVMNIKSVSAKIECETRMGNESATMPAVLTIERVKSLRFPSIRSKTGVVEVLNADDIGADKRRTGLIGSPTRVLKTYTSETGKRKCTFISQSELPTVLEEALKREYCPIPKTYTGLKLKEAWAVGNETAEIARQIADHVRVIERTHPFDIAELAKKEGPKVILWPGDLWGRKNAPQAAALLNTGLCADCTHLETDGEKLYMYRPAYGGSLMAKIVCDTLPAMATVRTETAAGGLIVGVGKGAADDLGRLLNLAKRYNGVVSASRAMVDTCLVPYEYQVGLTGKCVAPKVYLAVGIRGAVQHICGVENAGTIVAINSDKDAEIFQYSDFGIIANSNTVQY